MKLAKFLALAAVSMVAGFVYADAANTLITFSTKGPDTYADGSQVLDGERYALVWWSGDSFSGIQTDGTAAGDQTANKVFFIAPLAKDHRCPPVIFQIDSKEAPSSGTYGVYLLDTRTDANTLATDYAGAIKGAAVANTYGAASGTTVTAAAKTSTDAVAASSDGVAFTAEQATALQPKITGFVIDGDNAIITVSNVQPLMAYEVRTGLDKAGKVEGTTEAVDTNTVKFTVPTKDASIFSIKTK